MPDAFPTPAQTPMPTLRRHSLDAPVLLGGHEPLFLARLPRSFWSRWADLLTHSTPERGRLDVSDLATEPLCSRPKLDLDVVIERIVTSGYDSRHPDYCRTISSWAHFTTRPISAVRGRALSAMSASAFLIDDLIDGWEAETEPGPAEAMATDDALVDTLQRRFVRATGDQRLDDAIEATRRASDLAFALSPNDRWWTDYVREMASFVYGRRISAYLASQSLLLPPELYLRTRLLDVGASMATTFASLAVDAYPRRSRGRLEMWALGWLHLISTNDLYSYYRERDETGFNIVHVVHAFLSRTSPTSIAQAVDRVVRFCNRLFARMRYLALVEKLYEREDSEVSMHVDAVLTAVSGGLEFVREHPQRYRDPATLSDYETASCSITSSYGQRWWTRSHLPDVRRFLDVGRVSPLCIDSWAFALDISSPRLRHRPGAPRQFIAPSPSWP